MKYKINMKKLAVTGMMAAMFMFAACSKEQKVEPTVAPSATVTPTATPTQAPATSELFDAYTEEMFLEQIVENTVNLHYTLAYPENFGIKEYETSLGTFNVEDMQAAYEEMKEMKKELEAFAYDELTKEQKFTYDIMMDYIETELMVADLPLYTEVLGPSTGYQAQLPVILAEYHFRSVRDVEDYLALLAQIDDVFAEMIAFEQEKSEAGLFMADMVADSIIEQCRKFIENPEENYMIDVFETEINAVEGLSEEEKQNYIAKNKELLTTEVVDGYRLLIEGLEALKGTGTNDKGLCHYEDGKRYYEYLVRSLTGSDKTVEELMTQTMEFIVQQVEGIQKLYIEDVSILNRSMAPEYCETEPEAILEDLIEKISVDFPALPEVNYRIKKVHPSMQGQISPAFYLIPPVDDIKNHVIYIDESQLDESTIYSIMAHEGVPGHLYQNVYRGISNLPLIRNMFSYQGYSEGWATYIQYDHALGFGLEDDEKLAEFCKINYTMSFALQAYIDMGIHYLGWDANQVEEFLAQLRLGTYGMGQQMFELSIKDPANYLSYFVGYMEMLELQETAKEAWGENFSLKKFHEAVLTLGPAPFYLLEEQIKIYE